MGQSNKGVNWAPIQFLGHCSSFVNGMNYEIWLRMTVWYSGTLVIRTPWVVHKYEKSISLKLCINNIKIA